MNQKLFLIAELEEGDVSSLPASKAALERHPDANQVTLGGVVHTVVDAVEGETRRWTRTDHYILRDPEGRHWAVPYETNPTDHDGGAEGFTSHATDHGNPTHVTAYAVGQVAVTVTTWEPVP